MTEILLKNAAFVNEDATYERDLLIKNGRIEKIANDISADPSWKIIDLEGLTLLPGIIDDQVHFREPGAEYKANIASESKAAVLGGTTSFMDMPNNNPPAITYNQIKAKNEIAKNVSPANYAFYLGASGDNLEEIKKLDPKKVCGVKIFMGSSTGTLLVDDEKLLKQIFAASPILIATHCEDNSIIKNNLNSFIEKYGEENLTAEMHPLIRSREACLASTLKAIRIAKETNARLHVLHISTKEEAEIFGKFASIPLADRRITAEACVHHLFFNDTYYKRLKNNIKCNPAIKTEEDRRALLAAVRNTAISCIATDHAPHTAEEKALPYFKAPAGLPLIQFTMPALLELVQKGEISIEEVVRCCSHNPAMMFNIKDRGFIREGYFADLVAVNMHKPLTVTPNIIASKCGWSPFTGYTFKSSVIHTFVNGVHVVENGKLIPNCLSGKELEFDR